jgi:hypothetical protein
MTIVLDSDTYPVVWAQQIAQGMPRTDLVYLVCHADIWGLSGPQVEALMAELTGEELITVLEWQEEDTNTK